MKGAVTAPVPMPSISAATEEAWHSRVQWSTLLVRKPVRTSFWNRIGLLVAALGRAEAGQRVAAVAVADGGEAAGGDLERLLPAGLAEMRPGVARVDAGIDRLGRVLAADQRLGQALRAVGVVEAEAALDAQPVLVGRPVAAGDEGDLVVADMIGDLAADAAVRADAVDLAVGRAAALAGRPVDDAQAGISAPVGQAWTHSPQATQVLAPIGIALVEHDAARDGLGRPCR